MRCPFMIEKWKELVGLRGNWKFLEPNTISYERLAMTEFSRTREQFLKGCHWRDIDIKRVKDRMIMSAMRNGTLAEGKYELYDYDFWYKKGSYFYNNLRLNRENVYDLANIYFYLYTLEYWDYEKYRNMTIWLGQSSRLLKWAGIKYEPKDRIN